MGLALFISALILLTSYIVSSTMSDNTKTTYYIGLVVLVLLMIITKFT